jgi:DNA-binding transcriptional regulator LsrR (DeoR family)
MKDGWYRLRGRKGRFAKTPEHMMHSPNTLSVSITYALFKTGLRTDEIARRLGCTEAAVANSLAHLRERRRAEAA